ncbi:MAG: indole-3-glycerol phosphate synthase TrpC [Chloroflexi bacterium]|nr:indole-3-glycerol phosphate synthase TrpC [Chloroflexota bacterium]
MFLDEIVALKRTLLKEKRLPLRELEKRIEAQPPPVDFAAALQPTPTGWPRLIAEAKKASPSKGLLVEDYDPVALATTYVDNGAAAISVLTEDHYFQGGLEHLESVRRALDTRPVRVPVLRKDFLLDPYHVWEARAYGADAFLAIVAILKPPELRRLLEAGGELGMAALVEVHSRHELEAAIEAGAPVIGINNRDLQTFQVDLAITEQLRPLVPSDKVVVSESGIQGRSDVERLARWGVHAILVGEALVSAPDIAAKVKELAG